MAKSISRRDFIKGLAAGTASITAMSVLGACTATAENTEAETTAADKVEEVVPEWMPAWDEEADIIVVGYGGSGATAAMAAKYEGASVIVLEKSHDYDGGSTAASGGHIHTCANVDAEEWVGTIMHGSFGSITEEVARDLVANFESTPEWMDKYGVRLMWVDESNDGHKRPLAYQGAYVDGREGRTGMYLWEELDEVARNKYGVDVRLETPAKELVQNPLTKEILGVKAEHKGQTLYFKAKKGVVLACGGYEGNAWMQYNFNYPGVRLMPWGTPNNTGDGIVMAQQCGAQLWHMHALEFSSLNFKVPSDIANCSISTDATKGITPYNYVIVNYEGKRFMKEDKTGAHDMGHQPGLDFDSKACDYENLPMFLVFDQDFLDAGPLWKGTGRAGIINTYAGVWNHKHPDDPLFVWGDDNTKALEEGWIFKGETLEELAANIKGERPCGVASEAINGINAKNLMATIDQFNGYCAAGEDPDFNRDPSHMLPIQNGPFYAIELGFSCINSQGGPRRNGSCQTMNALDQPIPRLYNVGECGSYNGCVYAIGNIYEALATGRIAVQHILANNTAWDEA